MSRLEAGQQHTVILTHGILMQATSNLPYRNQRWGGDSFGVEETAGSVRYHLTSRRDYFSQQPAGIALPFPWFSVYVIQLVKASIMFQDWVPQASIQMTWRVHDPPGAPLQHVYVISATLGVLGPVANEGPAVDEA